MVLDISTGGSMKPGDSLAMLHGKKKGDIYVILSKDGSSVLKDPGLDRPWSSPNKKLAEHHAKKRGLGEVAVDLITACQAIIRHPKNQPGYKGEKYE